jgi:hypothetical protein
VDDRADNDAASLAFCGAILVTTASLAGPLLVILLIFAIAGAGD